MEPPDVVIGIRSVPLGYHKSGPLDSLRHHNYELQGDHAKIKQAECRRGLYLKYVAWTPFEVQRQERDEHLLTHSIA